MITTSIKEAVADCATVTTIEEVERNREAALARLKDRLVEAQADAELLYQMKVNEVNAYFNALLVKVS